MAKSGAGQIQTMTAKAGQFQKHEICVLKKGGKALLHGAITGSIRSVARSGARSKRRSGSAPMVAHFAGDAATITRETWNFDVRLLWCHLATAVN